MIVLFGEFGCSYTAGCKDKLVVDPLPGSWDPEGHTSVRVNCQTAKSIYNVLLGNVGEDTVQF